MQAYHRAKQVDDLIQPVSDLIEFGNYVIAVLDWIDGDSLKEANLDLLPNFFSLLSDWHKKNINTDAIYSPYTDEEYESVDVFIEAEVIFHLNNAGLSTLARKCIALLSALNYGYSTILHGDIHPGNIQFDGSRFMLLDPEYVHCGINVLDLDYVNFDASPAKESPWWEITLRATECLYAYFADDTDSKDHIGEIMKSVKIINSLRSISNSLIYKTGTTNCAIEHFRNELLEAG
jgi:hypothetical protein